MSQSRPKKVVKKKPVKKKLGRPRKQPAPVEAEAEEVPEPLAGEESATEGRLAPFSVRKMVRLGQIAEFTGLTLKSLEAYTREGILENHPPEGEGGNRGRVYDIFPTLKALIKLFHARSRNKAAAMEGGDLNQERLLKTAAQRKMEELKLALAEGEAVEIARIRKIFSPMFGRLRSNLLALPLRAAPLVKDGGEVNAIASVLEKLVKEALHEVSIFDMEKLQTSSGRAYLAEHEDEDTDEMNAGSTVEP